jgi:ABC-type antimicrobial peptide transport system permease subunit
LLVGQGGRQLGVGVLLALPVVVGTGIGFSSFFPVGLATTLACVAGVTLSIIGVVLLATYIPTRRALTVSPRDALWRE